MRCGWAAFIETSELCPEFLYILLISCKSISPCKWLPVDMTPQGPCPFIVLRSFKGWIEIPFDGTFKLIAEYIMSHRPLCFLDNLGVRCKRCCVSIEKINRFFPCTEMFCNGMKSLGFITICCTFSSFL